MKKRRFWIIMAVLITAGGITTFLLLKKKPERWQELTVESERFVLNIAESGTVQPENKITLSAPIAGRVDKILVEEGTKVKRGQIIAWMSSTDRAALIDSAESQGKEALSEMIDVYKPTPIISPTNGVIIARNVVVGQTVTSSTGLFDISDRLIVMADVDETDLAKIRVGQDAAVKVDSFPDLPVTAKVIKIAHQSVTKNAINVYQVQLEPDTIPAEFRSGLTASVYFVLQDKDAVPVLPAYVAEGRENFTTKIRIKSATESTEMREVKFGPTNGQKVAVLKGLKPGEVILVKEQKILTENKSTNPFGGPPRINSKGGKR